MNGHRKRRQAVRRQTPVTCLILCANVRTADQIAGLLEKPGCRMHVVHSDKQAYKYMLNHSINIAIADIDAVDMGGLAVLVSCYHQDPSVATFAITPDDDGYRKKLARDLAGCRGFFYLVGGSPDIDSCRGIAVNLTTSSADKMTEVTDIQNPAITSPLDAEV